MSDGKVAKA